VSGGGGEAESFGVVAKRPEIAESEEVRGEGGETRCPSLAGPEASVLL